jgi:hypothetical protein
MFSGVIAVGMVTKEIPTAKQAVGITYEGIGIT